LHVIVQALKDYFLYLGLERRASEATIRAYEGDIGQFLDFLREELSREAGFTDANGLAVRSFLGRLSRNGYSKRSIARKVASLKSFFGFCIKRRLCAHDPTTGVSAPKAGRDLPVFASVAAMERMMNLPPIDSRKGLRDRAVLELLYGTGMRLSELVECTIAQCNFMQGTITVLGKRNKQRMLPLGGKAAEYLKLYLQNRFGVPESLWSSREGLFGFLGESIEEPLVAGRGKDPVSRRTVQRFESRSGASRAREPLNDADIHACHDGEAARGIREGPSTSLMSARSAARNAEGRGDKGILVQSPTRHYFIHA
jgi:site-specific recombinase XerD